MAVTTGAGAGLATGPAIGVATGAGTGVTPNNPVDWVVVNVPNKEVSAVFLVSS